MEYNDYLTIVIDPGHGGQDNGASYNGRMEKDDNLRLGLEVQKFLTQVPGVNVIMTRDTDEFITLQRRAQIANQADADLFVALHRNSYTEQTPSTNGVENWIYLTAPAATAERAAKDVLDQVVSVGVQSDRGVKRGNYYVLRKTTMPAMLLEMGYIINDEDNRLFDDQLTPYAQAIVRGILQYFGRDYQPGAGSAPSAGSTSSTATRPAGDPGQIRYLQQALNDMYRAGLSVDGIYGPLTKAAVTRAIQAELNRAYDANLQVDGLPGPDTCKAFRPLRKGSTQPNLVFLLQVLLIMNGYQPGSSSGIYGERTTAAVSDYQRDNGLTVDGVAGSNTICSLLA